MEISHNKDQLGLNEAGYIKGNQTVFCKYSSCGNLRGNVGPVTGQEGLEECLAKSA